MQLSRRSFMAAAGAVAIAPSARVLGANDDIRVAIVGVNGKGGQHIKNFGKVPGVRVVALCDPDTSVLENRSRALKEPVQTYTDLRRLYESKDVDAVVIATPNHWHALASIWAMQAGKDVYVEKPVSYDIWESRQMIAAARQHNRIVQSGTQRRSDAGLQAGLAEVRDGVLGKINCVRVLYYSMRGGIGRKAPWKPSAPVDYNLWAGPAPMSDLTRDKLHYDWHWVWETGNGELGNNGPHMMDLARSVLGDPGLAKGVMSIGGRYGWDDAGETPNTHIVFYDYQPAPIIAEIRNLPVTSSQRASDVYKGVRVGIVVECENGYFGGLTGGALYDNDGKLIRKIKGDSGEGHPANFIKAVRSRKVADLTADIAVGHLSCGLCHQGNISHRLGQPASPEVIEKTLKGDKLAAETYERFRSHLNANQIDVAKNPSILGPALAFDTKAERFTGAQAAKANALMQREYRNPFVVPQMA